MTKSTKDIPTFVAELQSRARSRYESLPRDSFASVTARRFKGTYDEAGWVLAGRAGGASGIAIWVTAMLLLRGLRARRALDQLGLRSYLRWLPRRSTTGGG